MQKKEQKNAKNKKEILLEKYEDFLDFIEKVLNEKLPDSTRVKNLSNYTLLLNGNGEANFIDELFKKYDIIQIAKKGFIEDAIKEKKSQIRSAEVYVVPIYEELYALNSIFFIKKKNKIDKLKQKVKSLLDDILPKPSPHYN